MHHARYARDKDGLLLYNVFSLSLLREEGKPDFFVTNNYILADSRETI